MDTSDEEDLALLLLAEAEEVHMKKRRTVWVRQHFQMRPVLGEFHTTFQNLIDHPDEVFFNYMRMSYDSYKGLKDLIMPHIRPIGSNWRKLVHSLVHHWEFHVLHHCCQCHTSRYVRTSDPKMPENVDKTIDNLTIIEIKSELRKRGLSMSGCKGVLLDRLRESLQQNSAEPESSRSDVTTMTPGSNQPGPEDNSVSLRCVLLAVNQLQADVRALDLKFTNHISAISEKLSTAFPDKEKLTQLELEKQKLLDTFDMLSRDNNKNTITPPVARVEQLKTCSSTIGCTSVPTKNRFAPLSETPDGDADILGEDSGVAEAEKIIDSYYDALRPSTNGRHTPESERNVS